LVQPNAMGKRKERPSSSSTSTACTSARRDDDYDASKEARRHRDDDDDDDCEHTVAPAAAATCDPAGLPANEVGGETRPETSTGIRKKRRKDKKRKAKKRKRTVDGHMTVLGAPSGGQSSPNKPGTDNAADEGCDPDQSSDDTAKASGTFDRSAPGDHWMRIKRWKIWGFIGRERAQSRLYRSRSNPHTYDGCIWLDWSKNRARTNSFMGSVPHACWLRAYGGLWVGLVQRKANPEGPKSAGWIRVSGATTPLPKPRAAAVPRVGARCHE
jgi:hypothetical protein